MTRMSTPAMAGILALPLALALSAIPASTHGTADHAAHQSTAMEGAMAEEMLRLPDIAVTDSHGRTEGFVSRYGQAGPVLISFMYVACDDTCGMIRGIMKLVDDDLQLPGAPPLHLIAISVDPANDTPEVLARLATDMEASANWDWVVASQLDTPALLSAFGLDAGPIESHESVYLLGDLATGKFLRISGVPDPDSLIRQAREITPGA